MVPFLMCTQHLISQGMVVMDTVDMSIMYVECPNGQLEGKGDELAAQLVSVLCPSKGRLA